MKTFIVKLVVILLIVIALIKFVPPINDLARENLPESVLGLIGEKPMGLFERGSDLMGDSIEKGSEFIKGVVEDIKD